MFKVLIGSLMCLNIIIVKRNSIKSWILEKEKSNQRKKECQCSLKDLDVVSSNAQVLVHDSLGDRGGDQGHALGAIHQENQILHELWVARRRILGVQQ